MASGNYRNRAARLIRADIVLLLASAALLAPACSVRVEAQFPEVSPQLIQRIITTRACPGCQLAGADFSHQDLSGVDLSGADLRGTHFEQATLTRANLSHTRLQGAFMEHAILFAANLRWADLRGVNLIDVRLAGADLRDTDMTDIDSYDQLDLMELTGVRLEGARFRDGITCGGLPPEGGWGCVPLETAGTSVHPPSSSPHHSARPGP